MTEPDTERNPEDDSASLEDDELVSLFTQNQKLIQDRIKQLEGYEQRIKERATRYLVWAKINKLLIITVGTFIATRIVADGIWPPSSGVAGSIVQIVVPYTVLSVLIALIGGLDTAFKPGETATELNFMAVKCSALVRETEELWARLQRQGVSLETLEQSDVPLAKVGRQIEEVELRLAQLSLSLG